MSSSRRSPPPPPPPPPPGVPLPVNRQPQPYPHHLGFAGGPAQSAPHQGFAGTSNPPPPPPDPPRQQYHLRYPYAPRFPQAPPPPAAYYPLSQLPSQRQPSVYYPKYPLQYNPPPQPPSQRQPSMYYPSSQYPPQYNPLTQPPPPPPSPPSIPPPSVQPHPPVSPPLVPLPPSVPPPSVPPPPPPPRTQPVSPASAPHGGAKEAPPQQQAAAVPPAQKISAEQGDLSGPSGQLETEDMKKRKRRAHEKQKQEETKQSESTVLQKMKTLALGSARSHGKMVGPHTRERQMIPLLGGQRFKNRLQKPTTFLCGMKFRNELPDPTAQPKLLSTESYKDRYTRYSITSMEKMDKPELFVEPDLGIPLDLLDMNVYNRPGDCPPLAPEDEELLHDDEEVMPSKQEVIKKKERPTDKGVSWLVKTQYISPICVDAAKESLTEKQAKEIQESKEGQNTDLGNLNDREKQIEDIEESFRAAKLHPIHQTNPALEPVEILPIFPDFDRYKDHFVMVNFDGEPTADSEHYGKLGKSVRDELETQAIMKNFIIKGSDPAKQEKFFGYMVPAPDKLAKDKKTEKEDMSYSWVRGYHWDVRDDNADNPATYLLTCGDKDSRYLPLPTKLVLHRKAKEGRSGNEIEHFPVPAKVTVKRKPAAADEELKEPGETSGENVENL